jgi:hypothetical protein
MRVDSEFICLFLIATAVMGSVFLTIPFMPKEKFTDFITNNGYPTSQLCSMPLTSPLPELSGPADSSLTNTREPYHLLGDYLEPAGERLANLKSECAYVADGQRLIEKTGSYGQITNNYKKEKPDNGTTLLRELSLSFYK